MRRCSGPLGNKGRDLAVLDAADPDAILEARIRLIGRLRIVDVDHVVFVYGDVARPAEILPFGDEFTVRLENLNTVVSAVGHIDPSRRIERDAMGCVDLARRRAVLAPSDDEFPIVGELHDAVIGPGAMPIADIYVTIRRDDDRARLAELR